MYWNEFVSLPLECEPFAKALGRPFEPDAGDAAGLPRLRHLVHLARQSRGSRTTTADAARHGTLTFHHLTVQAKATQNPTQIGFTHSAETRLHPGKYDEMFEKLV